MAINKYLPFAFVYFFLNSLGLPMGLTYTALLTPFLYWWVLKARTKEIILPFLICLFPFVFVHVLLVGVDDKVYLDSFLNLLATYVFCQAFYTFLRECREPERIFKRILLVNFGLCLIGVLLYFTRWKGLFWSEQSLTEGIDKFQRLKLLTYEPSYYAMLLVPLFFFFSWQIALKQNKMNALLIVLSITLPFALSFSLGVISAILFSLLIVLAVHVRRLLQKRRIIHLLAVIVTVLVPSTVILLMCFPENSLIVRLENLLSGYDTSGKGRTYEAFYLSEKILALKSSCWGIGLGQIKVIGTNVIKDFYLYTADYKSVAIPNATAETLAIFGMSGLLLRIGAEVVLFFYTKVWKNYFRLSLFLFVFIYQFSGSFITNVAEYVIWILAFTNVFRQFDVLQRESEPSLSN